MNNNLYEIKQSPTLSHIVIVFYLYYKEKRWTRNVVTNQNK